MKQLVITNDRFATNESRSKKSVNNYFDELKKYPPLSPEEEAELIFLAKNGDDKAKEKIINHNLRFVVSVAKRYEGEHTKLEDLISEGNIGLILALERFDVTTGFKFISYAVWWIRQRMIQYYTETSRTIRIPQNRVAAASKINGKVRVLEQELERKLGPDEIFEEFGGDFTKGEIDYYLNADKVSRTTSLDAPLTDENNSNSVLNLLENKDAENPSEVLDNENSANNRNALLSKLTEREALVLELYFGFNNNEPMSADEIANELGVTPTVIYNVKNKALRRLKFRLRTTANWMIQN